MKFSFRNSFLVFTAFLLLNHAFSGCSLRLGEGKASVVFSVDEATKDKIQAAAASHHTSVSRTPHTQLSRTPQETPTASPLDLENFYIEISLLGDYSIKKTVDLKKENSVEFDNLDIGRKVYVFARCYRNDATTSTPSLVCEGSSKKITLREGYNYVDLKLFQTIVTEAVLLYDGGTKSSKVTPSPSDGNYSFNLKKLYWTEWPAFNLSTSGEAGKNYAVEFDIFTDKDVNVCPRVRTSTNEGKNCSFNLEGGTWTSMKVFSGIYADSFTNFILELPFMSPISDLNVSVKNIRVREASDSESTPENNLVCNSWASNNDISTIHGKTEDGKITLIFDKAGENSTYWERGIKIVAGTLVPGRFYKVSLTVNAENSTDYFASGMAVGAAETVGTNWCWANSTLAAGQDIEIVSYLNVLTDGWFHSMNGLMENISRNENPSLSINICDGRANKIVIKDIKIEAVSMREMPLSAGWHSVSVEGYSTSYDATEMFDYNQGHTIIIPARGSVFGKIILVRNPQEPWDTSCINGVITLCTNYTIYGKETPSGITVSKWDNELIKITNETDSEAEIKLIPNDEFRFFIEKR